MVHNCSFYGTKAGVCRSSWELNSPVAKPDVGAGPLGAGLFRPTVRPSDRPSDRLKSSKIQFAFNKVGPIFCAVKATIMGHILASFGVKLVGF